MVEKCKIQREKKKKTTFLSFIISADGIEMDPAKVEAVLNWETLKSMKDVQCSLGSTTNFYRYFINKYSNLCQPFVQPIEEIRKTGKPIKIRKNPLCPGLQNVIQSSRDVAENRFCDIILF